jgi:hypothetical protein
VKEKRPFIITIIADIYILVSFLLVLSLFTFINRYGFYIYSIPYYLDIPVFYKNLLILLNAIILFIISLGYLKLKVWGYWAMICYNLFYLAGWIISYQQNMQKFFPQNIISLIIGLIFIFPTIKYFKKVKK